MGQESPLVEGAKRLYEKVENAVGIGHLYTRDKAGKFNKIESTEEVDKILAEGVKDRDYWIFTKDPSVQAFTDLMNRYIDKPIEPEENRQQDVTHRFLWGTSEE